MSTADDSGGLRSATRAHGEWRRLIVGLLLILSPSLIAAAALEWLAWRIGETMSAESVSKWQDAAPGRVWRGGDGHSFLPYKLARIADLKPEIIALGPSRANALKGGPFAPYSFYNAGWTAWTFDQYRRFLDLIARDGYAPRMVVFDLDYWMFSPGFDHYWSNRFDETPDGHIASLLRVVGQLRDDPGGLWRRLPATGSAHGLYAVLTGDGFAADGCLPEKQPTADPQRLEDDGTGASIPPVVLADHVAPEQVAKFDQFVAAARAKGIALVGVQLPLYKKILDALNDSPDAGLWREFATAEWRQRLADSGITFFDFADMPQFRDRPEYFLDSLDPAARPVEGILQSMIADDRIGALLPKAAAAR